MNNYTCSDSSCNKTLTLKEMVKFYRESKKAQEKLPKKIVIANTKYKEIILKRFGEDHFLLSQFKFIFLDFLEDDAIWIANQECIEHKLSPLRILKNLKEFEEQ